MGTDHSDFIAKLRQIEELANGVHAELPATRMMWRTRVQHILVLAKTLRGRLEVGGLTIAPAAATVPPPVAPDKPPV